MADDLEERIAKTILAKFQAGLAGVTVARPPGPALEIAPGDCPAVSLRKGRKTTSQHLRGAEEFLTPFTAICLVDGAAADPSGELSALRSRVKAVVEANRLWNDGSGNLAAETDITADCEHETEIVEGTKSGFLEFVVHAYADRENPANVKAI
jgi:hypothetical protein